MSTWWRRARDAVRAQLWPIPTLGVVLAVLLGLGLPRLDAAVDGGVGAGWSGALFGGDADAARSLLGSIASSLINVTALTFSLTVVTLQLASSQFSPRLLRTFSSDGFVQSTLALFLGTFTYALTVLRSVRNDGDEGGGEFVPRIAVSLSFLLAVTGVVGLVLFLAHLTRQIRVETMMRHVHDDAAATMRAVLEQRTDRPRAAFVEPPTSAGAAVVSAECDGFVTSIDSRALLDGAVAAGAVVRLDVHPGSFVVSGTPVGRTWSVIGGRLDPESVAHVGDVVSSCVRTGPERTAEQDVGFGLRQLSDVANKALSPGINDPTTAVHALGHISALLCALAQRDLGPELLRDDDGRTRVVARRPDLAAYVELGLAQPRRYGATDPDVLAQLFRVLLDLAHRVPREGHDVVRAQLQRLRGTVARQDFDEVERTDLAAAGAKIEEVLEDRGRADRG